MFDDIQHIGYLVDDLDGAVAWFGRAFGAVNAGGTNMQDSPMVPGGGRNAFVRFGAVEVELMEPADTSKLPKQTLVMHHVGYVTDDIAGAAAAARERGLKFLADAPYTNPMGQQVHYLDPATTNGVWMHLTKVPDRDRAPVGASGPTIAGIVHPGYLVRDLDRAVAWHVEKLAGRHVGGGPSRRGGRIAFIDCGGAQIELSEPANPSELAGEQILDHVGYLTTALDRDLEGYRQRGLAFDTAEPAINPIGQRLIYFAAASAMGTRMHLTELPG